jgi:hypothetical protein
VYCDVAIDESNQKPDPYTKMTISGFSYSLPVARMHCHHSWNYGSSVPYLLLAPSSTSSHRRQTATFLLPISISFRQCSTPANDNICKCRQQTYERHWPMRFTSKDLYKRFPPTLFSNSDCGFLSVFSKLQRHPKRRSTF